MHFLWPTYFTIFYKLALILILGWVTLRILLKVLNTFLRRGKWLNPGQDISNNLESPLIALVTLIALDIAIPNFPHIQRLYIACAIWILSRTVKVFKIICYVRFDSSQPDNLAARKVRTQLQFVERTITIFLFFIGIALILMTFDGVRALGSSLFASAGIVGIVVGFAAQKSLGTFLTGLQVAFTQPIRIDDVVVVEGEWGVIEEITLTYVVVKIWDLRRLIVPIGYFADKCFQNWTRNESSLLGFVLLNFDYGVNVDKLRVQFAEILSRSSLWDQKVSVVQVTDATEQSLQIRFLMSARSSPDAFDLRCEVREKILAYVQTHAPEHLPRVRISQTNSMSGSGQS